MTSGLDRKCEQHGCAKVCLDPNLHAFDDCFAGNIRFGDIDGAVERRGFILWMEWKLHIDDQAFEKTHFAQIQQAKNFTMNSQKQTFVFVDGNPETMEVRKFGVIHAGLWRWGWQEGTDKFRSFLKFWFSQADCGIGLGGVRDERAS